MKRKLSLAAMAFALLAGTVGYATAQDWRYDRDDDRYYDRGDYGYDNFQRGMHIAREIGWRDGQEVARGDLYSGKPFNPNPRGRFDDCDHGYRHEFGNKHEYRENYARAYHEGYERAFNDGRYYRRGW
jgi:hypothetical protein